MARRSDVKRPGIIDMVSRVAGGPFYTIKQVSTMIGKDPDSIRRWQKANEDLRPTHQMPLGEDKGQYVWLYTEADVKRLREFSATLRPGRPRKEAG
jgi:hypothetical protein